MSEIKKGVDGVESDILKAFLLKSALALKEKDIDKINATSAEFRAEIGLLKKDNPLSLLFESLELFDEMIALFTPLVKDGKLNNGAFRDAPEKVAKVMKEDVTTHLLLYQELKEIYEETYARYLGGTPPGQIHDGLLEFVLTQVQFLEDLIQNVRRNPDLETIKETLEAYQGVYEGLGKIIIIITQIIQVSKGDSRKITRIKDALLYVGKLDSRLVRIYNKFVDRIFRNMYAHHKIIRLDENRFYFFNKKRYTFTLGDLKTSLARLQIFTIFFQDIFIGIPSYNYLIELKEKILLKIIDLLNATEGGSVKGKLPQYYTELGILKANRGKINEALELILKSLELDEKAGVKYCISRDYYNLACFHSLNHQSEECIEYLKKAIALLPEWKEKAKLDEDFLNVNNGDQFRNIIF